MINWKVRYSEVLRRWPQLYDPANSVLEVGSGGEGIAHFLNREVVGIDKDVPAKINPNLKFIAGSIFELEIPDDSYAYVVCMDVMEHLDRATRRAAIQRMLRIAREKLIVGCPAGTFANEGDRALAGWFTAVGRPVPVWLTEHLQNGLPAFGELLDLAESTDRAYEVAGNEGVLQHYAGIMADYFNFTAAAYKVLEEKATRSAPLGRGEADLYYSYLFCFDKQRPRRLPPPAVARGAAAAPPPDAARGTKATVYAFGHLREKMPAVPGLVRMRLGDEARSQQPMADSVQDGTGDHIAARNSSFSEMTGIYWVWKNAPRDGGVGFCHYRRYFDFRAPWKGGMRETQLSSPAELQGHMAYAWDERAVGEHLDQGRIVLAAPITLKMSVPEYYMWRHYPEHYLVMLDLILKRYPELSPCAAAQAKTASLCANNMFIMGWADFDRLCTWWFECLFELERILPIPPDPYQRRIYSFLSERLFDIYIRGLARQGREIVQYPVLFCMDSAF